MRCSELEPKVPLSSGADLGGVHQRARDVADGEFVLSDLGDRRARGSGPGDEALGELAQLLRHDCPLT